jgi:hypothetical protein
MPTVDELRSARGSAVGREEFRVVTTFDPIQRYEHGATRTITDHKNTSLTFSTLEGAENNAEGMCRIHDPRGKPSNVRVVTIKEQRIERRVVTEWAEVAAD